MFHSNNSSNDLIDTFGGSVNDIISINLNSKGEGDKIVESSIINKRKHGIEDPCEISQQ